MIAPPPTSTTSVHQRVERVQIIRRARTHYVGKYQSCMFHGTGGQGVVPLHAPSSSTRSRCRSAQSSRSLAASGPSPAEREAERQRGREEERERGRGTGRQAGVPTDIYINNRPPPLSERERTLSPTRSRARCVRACVRASLRPKRRPRMRIQSAMRASMCR